MSTMTTSGGHDFVESIDPASMRRQLVEAGARLAAKGAYEAVWQGQLIDVRDTSEDRVQVITSMGLRPALAEEL